MAKIVHHIIHPEIDAQLSISIKLNLTNDKIRYVQKYSGYYLDLF